MRLSIIASTAILVLAADAAMAACSAPAATQVKNTGNNDALTALLLGNTVCTISGGDRWQEEHHAGGVLKDFKKGPSDKVDPTKQVGTWAVMGMGATTTVTYNYGNGGTHSYTVWNNGGGSYSFCGAGGMDFTLVGGVGIGCP